MRGKYITTSLKLAVGSRAKKPVILEIKETQASMKNFEIIWSKEMLLEKTESVNMAGPQLAVA